MRYHAGSRERKYNQNYRDLYIDKRVPQAEIDRMINYSNILEIRALIALLYLTGARVSELLKLTPNSIRKTPEGDIEITIQTLKKRWAQKKPYKHTRTLIFRSDQRYLDIFIKFYNRRGEVIEPGDRVFRVSRQLGWYYLRKRIPNQYIFPHAFRHNRLQRLADAGATAAELKAWSGHERPEMIFEYINASPHQIRRLKDMID